MRAEFIEYFVPSENEKEALWNSCIFAFDTNVLLNFYRYSPETFVALKNAILYHKDKAWIPYNVGYEFFEKRVEVINSQINNYNEKTKILKKLIRDFSENKGHPFISADLLNQQIVLSNKIYSEFEINTKKLSTLLNKKDTVVDDVLNLFDSKIGEKFSNGELVDIRKEAEIRFANLIPPGFEDSWKGGIRQYGDYIIWKQILNKARSTNKSIIFITDDEKDDWILKVNNRYIGPLPKLIREFNEVTQQKYYSYNTLDFIKRTFEQMESVLEDKILNEIEYVSSNKPDYFESNTNLYRIDFVIKLDDMNDADKVFSQFITHLEKKGYFLNVEEKNENIFYLTVRVGYEDLIRRFQNLLNEVILTLPVKLLSFNSNTINYYFTNDEEY